MIEATFRKTIEQFPDIVEFIEQLELSEEEHVSRIKAKLKLFDGSALQPSHIINMLATKLNHHSK
ncbi:MAG: hypothetical protein DDT32_02111 [Syntrophomonadaceae bacterium]|nr:hypothetical protein [Bacillota bacterium]